MNLPTSIQDGSEELAKAIQALADSVRDLSLNPGQPPAEVDPTSADSQGLQLDLADTDKWQQYLTIAKEKAIDFAPDLLAAVLITVLGWLLARALTSLLRKALGKSKLDSTLVNFVASVSYMAVMAFVLISAISKLGVNTASFIAVLGAAGFAVGFALQGSLSNFAAGVMLMIFRPMREGDLVEAGGVLGVVEEVGVFATIINTLENKRAVIANSAVTGANIINYTANGNLRVDMTFGIGYGDDMDKAMELMAKVLKGDERILASPAPKIACVGHGSSSVDFVCRPFVKPEHYWDVWFDTHKNVKEAFDAAGVSIPFPQRDVHMVQADVA